MSLQLDELYEHLLAEVFSFLDVPSRVRAARACKTFWRVIFASHRTVVWHTVQVPADASELEKLGSVLEENADVIVSLRWIADQEFGGLSAMEQIPELENLRHFSFWSSNLKDSDLSIKVEFKSIDGWAGRFPRLEVIRSLKTPYRWNLDSLMQMRRAWPHLHTFEGRMNFFYVGSDTGIRDLLDVFDGLKTVRLEDISLLATEDTPLLESLASSIVGKELQSLELTWICYSGHGCLAPETCLAAFTSLKALNIHKVDLGLWLDAGLASLPSLKYMKLRVCIGLAWLGDGLRASALTTLKIHECKGFDAEVISFLPVSLKSLSVHQWGAQFEFKLSSEIFTLASSGVSEIWMEGRLSDDTNSDNELDILYERMMEHPENFANMKKLSIDVYFSRRRLVWDPARHDLEELSQRLPEGCVVYVRRDEGDVTVVGAGGL